MEITKQSGSTKLIRVSAERHRQLKTESSRLSMTLTKLTEEILSGHYNQGQGEVPVAID
jgi:hypothetical protein